MSKERATIGTDGRPLPLLPPDRDPRLWGRMVRVSMYTPGFMALLLLKTGEPTSFGITVELLMLASASAIVAGLFIGAQSNEAGADHSSRVGLWSGALILELLAVVPLLCAIPGLFHELAHSSLLHARTSDAIDISLGASELLPAMAILPFMLYQLAGFGTLHYIVSKPVNWAINMLALALMVVSYAANRQANYGLEKQVTALLVVAMTVIVFYGVLKLRKMQIDYDSRCPPKEPKEPKEPK